MVSMKDIRAVARRIGREFLPRKVILFGSYAHGRPTEDSDVDLRVIMPVRGDAVYKSAEVLLKSRPPFPADILVRTPKEIRHRIAIGDFFIRKILSKGKVLHESSDRGMGGKGRGRLRQHAARTPIT